MEVADGSATQEQKHLFNQRLRHDSQLRDIVAQRLLDDATLIEELRTSGIDAHEGLLTFPEQASSHSLLSASKKVVIPFIVVFVFAALAWWKFREPLSNNPQAVPHPKPHTQAHDEDELPRLSQPTVKWPSVVGTVA